MKSFYVIVISTLFLFSFTELLAQNTGAETKDNTKLEITLKEYEDADVYIDGKKYDHAIIELLDKNKIESVSVLKDKNALKLYNAPNGVILIKSKSADKTKVKIRADKGNIYEADPLIIIDGKVMGQGQEALSKLSPNDIQSVSVLKGENALKSVYGAAVKEAKKQNGLTPSGVIIIKTKSSEKNQK
jgi:hypothetical protein